MLQKIDNILTLLKNNKKLEIVWIRGHSGIKPNEIVDVLAKTEEGPEQNISQTGNQKPNQNRTKNSRGKMVPFNFHPPIYQWPHQIKLCFV